MAKRPYRALIAGGGIAAIELLVALRKLAGDLVQIEVLAPGEHLVYRPLLVAEPFGLGTVHRFPLADILADQRAERRVGRLESVDPAAHEAVTDGGERLAYDALAVAAGARALEAVPGALTFGGTEAIAPLRELVERKERGELESIAFALPEAAAVWPLPLYEMALMTADRAGTARVVVVTAEREPLGLFGDAASADVRARLERAGIELHTGAAALSFADGELTLASGGTIAADAAVALPRLEGPSLEGLPHDEHGFIPVDEHMRVPGAEDVCAAGDVTAFAVKQGGVSVRQAQAAAECIAARAGAPVTPEPFQPVLRGMLLTGGEPSYMETGPGESLHADSPLWWPPTKIADSYLVPYLVARFQLAVSSKPGPGQVDLISSGPAGEAVRPRSARA
jgi:sulfide:quinone oxidoreductase